MDLFISKAGISRPLTEAVMSGLTCNTYPPPPLRICSAFSNLSLKYIQIEFQFKKKVIQYFPLIQIICSTSSVANHTWKLRSVFLTMIVIVVFLHVFLKFYCRGGTNSCPCAGHALHWGGNRLVYPVGALPPQRHPAIHELGGQPHDARLLVFGIPIVQVNKLFFEIMILV